MPRHKSQIEVKNALPKVGFTKAALCHLPHDITILQQI